MSRLFHVSEEAGIARFEPRPPPSPDAGIAGDCVWAVDAAHLANFLTPRDCPRICFARSLDTTEADAGLLGEAHRVVAIEAAWLERLKATRLYLYEMPAAAFELALPEAGYWISRQAVEPLGVEVIEDLASALAAGGAELRLVEDFWPLSDAVAASSLEFSIIRKRNAIPRRA